MNFQQLLSHAIAHKASDIHLAAGATPLMRVNAQLTPMITPDWILNNDTIETFLHNSMPTYGNKTLTEIDWAITMPDARLRLHLFNQQHGHSIAVRILPTIAPSIATLDLAKVFYTLCDIKHGLILITGPTGCGKTTSLAAMLDHINSTKHAHVITIEDPIEYIHHNKLCLIQQRELGTHTPSFDMALKAILREDPDYILVGELRDLTTMRLALTAAETGHLVLATLHTSSAIETIERIINTFPTTEQILARNILANVLQAVVAQVLIPQKTGNRIALQEIMVCNPAIRNLIRTDKITQIYSVIQTSQDQGMQTFDQHLRALMQAGIVATNYYCPPVSGKKI